LSLASALKRLRSAGLVREADVSDMRYLYLAGRAEGAEPMNIPLGPWISEGVDEPGAAGGLENL